MSTKKGEVMNTAKYNDVLELEDHNNLEFHNKNKYGYYLCYFTWKYYKRVRKSSNQKWCIHCGTKIREE